MLSSRTRSRLLSARPGNRYWWYQNPNHSYIPAIYETLTDDEWRILEDWFVDTDRNGFFGECNVPAISLLHGLLSGSCIRNIVELGHYCGYSTLLLGFAMRRMGCYRSIFSVDKNKQISHYTQSWIDKAGLQNFVKLVVSDSCSPLLPSAARDYFGAPISLVFIDSSHQYDQTLAELSLWYPQLKQGGLVFLHDTSTFSTQFDETKKGGVKAALNDWSIQNRTKSISLNADARQGMEASDLIYGDPCGLGIIQKPFA
jgi:predicted O-methyltransferase YrrM